MLGTLPYPIDGKKTKRSLKIFREKEKKKFFFLGLMIKIIFGGKCFCLITGS